MEDLSVSRSTAKQLLPGEKIIYRAPRNWSRLTGVVAATLLGLVLVAVYVLCSDWQPNTHEFGKEIPVLAGLSDALQVQLVDAGRLGALILGVLVLIISIPELVVLLGAKVTLTDRRILGRTGRFVSRRVDIPLDRIAWVDFPNHIVSKGPITIHMKGGEHTTLRFLAKPKILLGYLEAGHAADTKLVIQRRTTWGQLALMVMAIVALGILVAYAVGGFDGTSAVDSGRGSDGAPTQPGEAQPVAVVEAATPEPTSTPSLALGSPGADKVIAFNPGPGAKAQYGDADELLGDPDMVEQPCCLGMLQLGRGGSVVVAFTDNAVVNGRGADLQVYGESAGDDFLRVEVSEDGQIWRAFSKVAESSGPLDLADVGLARAVFVRLTDVQPGTSTGAELDAVVALHSGSTVGAPPALPDAVARAKLTLYDGPRSNAKAVDTVMADTVLSVKRRSSTNEWVEVGAPSGKKGWCRTGELALNVSLSGYAAVQVAPTATPPPPSPTAPKVCPSNPALVSITNLLDVSLRLDLKGPGTYRLNFAAGQTRNVCLLAGTYSYSAVAGGSTYNFSKSRTFEAGRRNCLSFYPTDMDAPDCNAPEDPGAYSPP
ncbi:MAG: SH3 domain-containing protein [Anaerolineae bacterium]|nr:SH3 domain-containing protein [Anaerolineae bacterium]